MYTKILFYYLTVITFFEEKVNKYITNTKSIHYLDKDNNRKSIFIRYIFIKIFNTVINFLIYIRNLCDIRTNKIQIIKHYDTGERAIIIDAHNLGTNGVSIMNVINHISLNYDRIKGSSNLGESKIITECNLKSKSCKKMHLNNLLLKYIDNNMIHHHTLRNILMFNNIQYLDSDQIYIKYMADGTSKINEYSISEKLDQHIYLICD